MRFWGLQAFSSYSSQSFFSKGEISACSDCSVRLVSLYENDQQNKNEWADRWPGFRALDDVVGRDRIMV
jgi:hypothetical protein